MSAIANTYATRKIRIKQIVHESTQLWMELGENLRIIKEKGEWREDSDSWAHFCEKLGVYTRRYIDQLIADVKAWKPLQEMLLQTGTLFPPITELAMRELRQIPTTEGQAEVVKEIIRNGETVTGTEVKKTAAKRAKARVVKTTTHKPETPPAPAESANDPSPALCPHCGQPMPQGSPEQAPEPQPDPAEVIE